MEVLKTEDVKPDAGSEDAVKSKAASEDAAKTEPEGTGQEADKTEPEKKAQEETKKGKRRNSFSKKTHQLGDESKAAASMVASQMHTEQKPTPRKTKGKDVTALGGEQYAKARNSCCNIL